MADSSRVQISYAKQDSKGTVPNSSFNVLRHTGGTFGNPTQIIRSNEVRGDGQRGAAVRTGVDPAGDLNLEFSAKTFDELISGFLRSSWSTPAAFSNTDAQADNVNSVFTTATGDFTLEDITAGQWVYVQGFDTTGANGWFKVTSVAAGELGVIPAPADDSNGAANVITMDGSYVRNGVEDVYYAFQLEHMDLTDKYRLIKDARIGSMAFSFDNRSEITGSFSFDGLSHELKAAKSGDGTVIDASNIEILNTTDHAKDIIINGDVYPDCVDSFSLNLDFKPRRLNGVGELESFDIALGSIEVSGSLKIYLTDSAWDNELKNYIDFTKISLAFPFVDSNGNGFVFELPQVALTQEPGNVPAPDEDIMLDFDFEAEPGLIGAEDKTVQICRRRV